MAENNPRKIKAGDFFSEERRLPLEVVGAPKNSHDFKQIFHSGKVTTKISSLQVGGEKTIQKLFKVVTSFSRTYLLKGSGYLVTGYM